MRLEYLCYGATFHNHWFSGSWLPKQVSQSIQSKELFLIVVAAYMWGPTVGVQEGPLLIR